MTHPGLDEIPDLPWRAASENRVDLNDCFNLAGVNRVQSTRCSFPEHVQFQMSFIFVIQIVPDMSYF